MSLSLGQSESYINRIENMKMMPSLTVFFYICEYLDVTPKDFFDNEVQSIEFSQLVKNLAELDPDQISHLSKIVKDMKR